MKKEMQTPDDSSYAVLFHYPKNNSQEASKLFNDQIAQLCNNIVKKNNKHSLATIGFDKLDETGGTAEFEYDYISFFSRLQLNDYYIVYQIIAAFVGAIIFSGEIYTGMQAISKIMRRVKITLTHKGRKPATCLDACIYHLLRAGKQGTTISTISKETGYSYSSVRKAILKLRKRRWCHKSSPRSKVKPIVFVADQIMVRTFELVRKRPSNV